MVRAVAGVDESNRDSAAIVLAAPQGRPPSSTLHKASYNTNRRVSWTWGAAWGLELREGSRSRCGRGKLQRALPGNWRPGLNDGCTLKARVKAPQILDTKAFCTIPDPHANGLDARAPQVKPRLLATQLARRACFCCSDTPSRKRPRSVEKSKLPRKTRPCLQKTRKIAEVAGN